MAGNSLSCAVLLGYDREKDCPVEYRRAPSWQTHKGFPDKLASFARFDRLSSRYAA